MAINTWLNIYCSLFKITGSKPEWLKDVGIESIQCLGNPNKDFVPGKLVLIGPLPEAMFLVELTDVSHYDIVYKKTGSRDDYDGGKVIISLRDCEVKGKEIEYPVAINLDDASQQFITVDFDCKVRFFIGN